MLHAVGPCGGLVAGGGLARNAAKNSLAAVAKIPAWARAHGACPCLSCLNGRSVTGRSEATIDHMQTEQSEALCPSSLDVEGLPPAEQSHRGHTT